MSTLRSPEEPPRLRAVASQPSLRRRVVRGALWSVIGGNASQLIAFACFLLISRLVGPSVFGVVAIALAIVEISRAFITESVGSVLVARREYDAAEYDAALPLALGVSLCASLLILACAPLLAALYQTPDLVGVLSVLACLVPLQAAARVQEAWLTRQMRFRALAARSIGAALAGGAVGLALAFQGYTYTALLAQQVVSAAAACALVWFGSAWRPNFNIDLARMKMVFRASATLTPASVISAFILMLDGLAAGLLGAASAGVYGLAKRVRLALQFGLSGALTRVATPAFVEAKRTPGRGPAVMVETLRVSMLLAFPVFLGVAAIAPELIALALDDRWAAAAAPLALLLAAGPISIAAIYAESVLLIEEKRKTIVALKASKLIVLLAALAIAAPLGVTAIAGAALLTTLYGAVAFYAAAAPLNQVSYVRCIGAIAPPAALAAALFFAVSLVREAEIVQAMPLLARTAVLIAVGATIYSLGAWHLARESCEAALKALRTLDQTRGSPPH